MDLIRMLMNIRSNLGYELLKLILMENVIYGFRCEMFGSAKHSDPVETEH